jgi:hypothetical protein
VHLLAADSSWWCVTWGDIAGGVVAGLIAALIAWAIGRGLRERRNRRDFGRLAGDYDVTVKLEGTPEGVVTLRRRGSNLDLTWVLANDTIATGTLAMNEQSRVTGSGSYVHETASGTVGGELHVQVAPPDTLFVDGVYTQQQARETVATAWVWRRRKRTHLATHDERGAP